MNGGVFVYIVYWEIIVVDFDLNFVGVIVEYIGFVFQFVDQVVFQLYICVVFGFGQDLLYGYGGVFVVFGCGYIGWFVVLCLCYGGKVCNKCGGQNGGFYCGFLFFVMRGVLKWCVLGDMIIRFNLIICWQDLLDCG